MQRGSCRMPSGGAWTKRWRATGISRVRFSADRDSLPQWRTYAHQGFGAAAGFKTSSFEKTPHFELVPVNYDFEGQRAFLRSLVDVYKAYIERKATTGNETQQATEALAGALLRVVATYKHPAYQSEKEFRVITACRKGERSARLPIQYRVTATSIVAYVSLRFTVLPLQEIVIGPCQDFELASATLTTYFEDFGLKPSLLKSEVNMRPQWPK
jgi:hypothetical protein